MKFLLHLKPWILFLIFLIGMIFSGDSSYYGLFICYLFFTIYIGWIYQIGASMYNLISNPKSSIRYFKFSCWFMGVSIILSNLFYLYFSQFIPHNATIDLIASISLPCYSFWSWLYISMFAARMLKSAAEGKSVNKSDSLKLFLCFFIFPIGVWYIQPTVQRVLKKYVTPPISY